MARKRAHVRPPSKPRSVGKNGIEQLLIDSGAAALYEDRGLVERVISVLGSNTVARLLGVSRSQPSRWRSGEEQMSPLNRARLSDLDHVLNRLLQVLWPEEAGAWLIAVNPHLGGRPVDVLALRGSGPVIEAIDALAQGAYA
ncbi:MAG TPA: hypothetical protein VFZ06_10140 [Acidimicrobiia bacterium]|nr:hypothetical protein [Acidimicrobiia bacterium]